MWTSKTTRALVAPGAAAALPVSLTLNPVTTSAAIVPVKNGDSDEASADDDADAEDDAG
eukprot:CAMPEP_0198694314 /NCGR_PEP_ID=MMETSP1468-20131203/267053_1 /TAXON_ID=1461545 /ORGANISM="Mantoniella sp, Strain CCMP1436" /LENGTH=58 /DNA_ID=CAMNT_0044449411 /DNA_START=370 /DNA_END=547 /DNA_ORIENTATION=+